MKIKSAIIFEIWQAKLNSLFLENKRAKWESIPLILLLLFLVSWVSNFNQTINQINFVLGITYIILAPAILSGFITTLFSKFTKQNKFLILTILMCMNDLFVKFILFVIFLCSSIGISISQKSNIFLTDKLITQGIFVLLFVIVGTVTFMPCLINKKLRENKKIRINYVPSSIQKLGIAASGISVMLASMMIRMGETEMMYAFMQFLGFICSVLLLHPLVIDTYELCLIFFNEWPKVKKTGTKILIVDEK